MPRSKRNKQIELAKTKKRGLEWKKRLFEEVRSCVDKYENVFIFSVNDMRNNKMKTVREQWKHSRFFIGKNKIMAMALGRFAEEEYKPNLHKLGQQIKGQRGLLFSNKSIEEVLSWFRSYSEGDYARSGNTATETVHLPAGPLTMFPHNLEPYLRELGLPTSLEKGVIHLIKDHEVCKAGDTLTPESAKILKLLGYEMAEFHITINCVWSKDGTFLQLTENFDCDAKENKKQKKKSSFSSSIIGKNKSTADEEMEIEQNDEESSDQEEEEGDDDDMSNQIENNIVDAVKTDVDNIITTTSTPKNKNNDVVEKGMSNGKKDIEKCALDCTLEEMSEKKENNVKCIDGKNDVEEVSKNIDDKSATEEINNNNHFEEMSEEVNVNPPEKNEQKVSLSKSSRPSISTKTPRNAKKGNASKNESLMKTPDANTSQDSPVFRELRNRSVKVVRKKKVINKK